jgi:hypothetical protein
LLRGAKLDALVGLCTKLWQCCRHGEIGWPLVNIVYDFKKEKDEFNRRDINRFVGIDTVPVQKSMFAARMFAGYPLFIFRLWLDWISHQTRLPGIQGAKLGAQLSCKRRKFCT